MNKHRIGIDFVEIDRFKKMLDRQPGKRLDQIFTKAEWNYCQTKRNSLQSLAARFAAKEACLKIFPRETAIQELAFVDIEIAINPYGAPYLYIGPPLQILMDRYIINQIHISMSHTLSYACAIAMAE